MGEKISKGRAALYLVEAIYEAIKESGSEGIPSGHLYTMIMDKISLDIYQEVIGILQSAGKIKSTGYLLTAI